MYRLLNGNCLDVLPTLPAQSVHCVVTSPPYWGLRDYGHADQLGNERTHTEYVKNMVAVFREVWRVLRDDGTLWLNLGDSYFSNTKGSGGLSSIQGTNAGSLHKIRKYDGDGLKPKDLVGIPWRVAFALQDDGWILRRDIVWQKPVPMPESVRDRCTTAHEYVFMLAKQPRYYYDSDAVREPSVDPAASAKRYKSAFFVGDKHEGGGYSPDGHKHTGGMKTFDGLRNRRSVWTITSPRFKGAHFATMPPKLVEPCILAGCPVGGVVLDPFAGSGTTGAVAVGHGRNFVGIELNPEYVALAEQRIGLSVADKTFGLFNMAAD